MRAAAISTGGGKTRQWDKEATTGFTHCRHISLRVTSTLTKHIPCTEAVLSHQYRMNPPPSSQWNGLWHPTGNSPWTVWAASEQKVALLVMSQLISIAILSLLLDRATVNICLENSMGKKKIEVMHNLQSCRKGKLLFPSYELSPCCSPLVVCSIYHQK